MGDAERIRVLAERLEGLCGPAEREHSTQLQNRDFAGTLADETEGTLTEVKTSLTGLADTLRDIADERQ